MSRTLMLAALLVLSTAGPARAGHHEGHGGGGHEGHMAGQGHEGHGGGCKHCGKKGGWLVPHMGVGVPILSSAEGDTVVHIAAAEDLVFEVPVGLMLRQGEHFAWDLELVPVVGADPLRVNNLVVHPGAVLTLRRISLALRAAFETDGDLGLTPGVQWDFHHRAHHGRTTFLRIDLPVRLKKAVPEDTARARSPGNVTPGDLMFSQGVTVQVGHSF